MLAPAAASRAKSDSQDLKDLVPFTPCSKKQPQGDSPRSGPCCRRRQLGAWDQQTQRKTSKPWTDLSASQSPEISLCKNEGPLRQDSQEVDTRLGQPHQPGQPATAANLSRPDNTSAVCREGGGYRTPVCLRVQHERLRIASGGGYGTGTAFSAAQSTDFHSDTTSQPPVLGQDHPVGFFSAPQRTGMEP